MKRWLLIVCLAALVAAPANAGGGIGASATYWAPDQADEEFAPSFKLDVDLGDRWDGEFRITPYNEVFSEGPGFFQMRITTMDLGIARQFTTAGAVEPYVGAGISYVELSSTMAEIPGEQGWYGVVGFEVPAFGDWVFFAEALVRSVKTEIEGQGLQSFVKQSMDLTGANVSAGLLFTW